MRRPSSERIRRLNARLEKAYGRPDRGKPLPPLDSLIRTILSQNTNDSNSHEGFRRLKKEFPTWKKVAEAPVSQIASAIKVSGLSNIKAPRIQAVLRRIKKERGSYSLDFVRRMNPPEANEYLGGFKGVGPKTAACVLMFSCGRPVFPVDTHVLRVSKRLGLIDRKKTAEQAHALLGEAVPADIVYPFHVLLIRHGRETCRAARPACERCVLRRSCDHYRRETKRSAKPKASKR